MPEARLTLRVWRGLIPAMIIEQFQARTIWQREVGDVEVAAIHRLLLLQAQNAAVKIERFFYIRDVDRDVINTVDFQWSCSHAEVWLCRMQPMAAWAASMPFLEYFSLGNIGRNKDLKQARVLAEFMQSPIQVFQWDFHGEERFWIDPAGG
jgi:hypothetical protein